MHDPENFTEFTGDHCQPRFKDDTLRRVLRIPKWVPFLICSGLIALTVVFLLSL